MNQVILQYWIIGISSLILFALVCVMFLLGKSRNRDSREIEKIKSDIVNSLRNEFEKEKITLDNMINKNKDTIQDALRQNKSELDNTVGQNRTNITSVIEPLRERIKEFKDSLEQIRVDKSEEKTLLKEEIKRLTELNQQVGKEAKDLTDALKTNSKIRGTWGEMILERVLESSGLEKYREYETQTHLIDENNNRYLTDVIIHLPEQRNIVIDSKVSLNAYLDFCSAETEELKKTALQNHIKSIVNHIKSLQNKKYDRLIQNSLDLTFMFVPIESAFQIIPEEKCYEILDKAYKENVVVITPLTLIPTLRVISNIWKTEYQNQNVKDIVEKAGAMYDKIVLVIESFKDVGNCLKKSEEAYEKTYNRMIGGRGNLIVRAHELRCLGTTTRKSLPEKLVQDAQINDQIDTQIGESSLPN